MTPGMKAIACLGGLALLAASCAVPVAPAAEKAPEPAFSVAAFDARGMGVPLDALPRRPEFLVSGTRSLAPIELVLLSGDADADLLDDLARPPLRAANAARVVPSRVLQRGVELRLAPEVALEPNANYVLALPGNAKVIGGSAIADAGPALAIAARTFGSASAGAAWIASLPEAAPNAVPPNFKAAFVAADGALALEGEAGLDDVDAVLGDALWIETLDHAALPARGSQVDCAELDARAITCLRLELFGALLPGARYVLRTSGRLRDLHEAPLPELALPFDVGSEADLEPPRFAALSCASDELPVAFGCLLIGDTWVDIRARADEPVRIAVRSWERQAGANVVSRTAQLAAAGDVQLTLAALEPASAFTLELEATDLAGNQTVARVELGTTPRLATLAITELLADPAGPDQAQEYVEVANFGGAPVSARGFTLADARDKPSVIADAVEIPAGARALLVADDFDPAAVSFAAAGPAAAAIPAGTLLIHVGSTLTQGGLQNAGEPLFLRDAEGHRLSGAPMRAAPSGSCVVRRGGSPRSARPEDFATGACTPGRPP